MTELDLPLLCRFLNELLSHRESHDCNDEAISLLTKIIDHEEKFFHVEGKTIWRKSSWRVSAERWAKIRIEEDIENKIVFARKDALKALREAVSKKLGIDDNHQCLLLCLKIMKSKNIPAAKMFGVDISELEEINRPYYIMEGDMYYEL
jgi:hypothetical protein